MKNLLIFVLLLAVSITHALGGDAGINTNSQEMNRMLKMELTKHQIGYEVREDGFIEYDKKDADKVQSIFMRLLQEQAKSEKMPARFKFAERVHLEAFVEYLKRKGISPEKISVDDEEQAVYWERTPETQSLIDEFIEEKWGRK